MNVIFDINESLINYELELVLVLFTPKDKSGILSVDARPQHRLMRLEITTITVNLRRPLHISAEVFD